MQICEIQKSILMIYNSFSSAAKCSLIIRSRFKSSIVLDMPEGMRIPYGLTYPVSVFDVAAKIADP